MNKLNRILLVNDDTTNLVNQLLLEDLNVATVKGILGKPLTEEKVQDLLQLYFDVDGQ